MALTSEDVNNQSFSIDRKGYNVDEVDVFLERVAAEVDELNATIERLEEQLAGKGGVVVTDGETTVDGISAEARIKELEAQVAEHRAEDSAIAQALIIAQRSADEIIANANGAAETTRQEASDEAQRILDKANADKARVLEQIKTLESDRELARDRYSDMLNEFIGSSQDLLNSLKAEKGQASRATHASQSTASYAKSAAGYQTPSISSVVSQQAKPSRVEKDFSGFGDTDDDFDDEDID